MKIGHAVPEICSRIVRDTQTNTQKDKQTRSSRYSASEPWETQQTTQQVYVQPRSLAVNKALPALFKAAPP